MQHESIRNDWLNCLNAFRERFIEKQNWSEKEAKLRLRDAWVAVRDGQVCFLSGDGQLPADAMPVLLALTPGGWKLPIQLVEHLTSLVTKAMTSQRPPRDIVLGLLSQVEHADGQEESDEIKQKRHNAAFWGHQLLDACEDESLAGVIEGDVFWQAVLYAFQAGRRHAILDFCQNPQLLADLTKAQAFQGGRSPDKLTQRLEESYIALRRERGRTKPEAVAKAAGGRWRNGEECWEFLIEGKAQLISQGGLYGRLQDIQKRHPARVSRK